VGALQQAFHTYTMQQRTTGIVQNALMKQPDFDEVRSFMHSSYTHPSPPSAHPPLAPLGTALAHMH
jgi:hypothetical protein